MTLKLNNNILNLNEKENRGENNLNKKKHINFNLYKKNTINSLNNVEYFLNNFNHFFKYFKLYKILKK